jgi:starch synthase
MGRSDVTPPFQPVRVLMVTAEMYPLAKTGGLADVCGALPPALMGLGIDCRTVMPGYPGALDAIEGAEVVAEIGDRLVAGPIRIVAGRAPDSGAPLWLVDAPTLFRRPGGPYTDADGRDWPDNAVRFAVLDRIAARIAMGAAGLDWSPNLVHGHDWHAGLVHALLSETGVMHVGNVFTIHNLAYQGNYPLEIAATLDLPPLMRGAPEVEFYGQFSFLKAGLEYADRITTVSRRYAEEITTPEFGCGLDGVLRRRGAVLSGVTNGIDVDLWNPARDPWIAAPYSADDRSGKAACKRALQQEVGFAQDPSRTIGTFVSRLAWQKMADVLLAELPAMLDRHPDLDVAVLGRGERDLERGFAELAAARPGRLWFDRDYDEPRAHRLHAGADLLLHGSRFEPCGLTQQYAMRYGTLPVARRTGGLADSITDAGADGPVESGATGFLYDAADGEAFRAAVDRALAVRHARAAEWDRMVVDAMRCDASWDAAAREYLATYAGLFRPTSAPARAIELALA